MLKELSDKGIVDLLNLLQSPNGSQLLERAKPALPSQSSQNAENGEREESYVAHVLDEESQMETNSEIILNLVRSLTSQQHPSTQSTQQSSIREQSHPISSSQFSIPTPPIRIGVGVGVGVGVGDGIREGIDAGESFRHQSSGGYGVRNREIDRDGVRSVRYREREREKEREKEKGRDRSREREREGKWEKARLKRERNRKEEGMMSIGERKPSEPSEFNTYVINNLSKFYNQFHNLLKIPKNATNTVYVEGIPLDATEREVSRKYYYSLYSYPFSLLSISSIHSILPFNSLILLFFRYLSPIPRLPFRQINPQKYEKSGKSYILLC